MLISLNTSTYVFYKIIFDSIQQDDSRNTIQMVDGKECNTENIRRVNSYIGRGVSQVQYSFNESNILWIGRLAIHYS